MAINLKASTFSRFFIYFQTNHIAYKCFFLSIYSSKHIFIIQIYVNLKYIFIIAFGLARNTNPTAPPVVFPLQHISHLAFWVTWVANQSVFNSLLWEESQAETTKI